MEYRWGSQRFLTYYLVTGVGAALFYSGVHAIEYYRLADVLGPESMATIKSQGMELWAQGQNYRDKNMGRMNAILNIPMLGASGAIYGVLLAFGMTFPNVELMVFPLFIPIKAKYFVWIFGALALFQGIQDNPGDNVAHLAHLGGMVVGFIFIKVWKEKQPWE